MNCSNGQFRSDLLSLRPWAFTATSRTQNFKPPAHASWRRHAVDADSPLHVDDWKSVDLAGEMEQ